MKCLEFWMFTFEHVTFIFICMPLWEFQIDSLLVEAGGIEITNIIFYYGHMHGFVYYWEIWFAYELTLINSDCSDCCAALYNECCQPRLGYCERNPLSCLASVNGTNTFCLLQWVLPNVINCLFMVNNTFLDNFWVAANEKSLFSDLLTLLICRHDCVENIRKILLKDYHYITAWNRYDIHGMFYNLAKMCSNNVIMADL